MKNLSFPLLCGCLLGLSSVSAQTDCGGIYLTAYDFLNGKLACASMSGRGSTASGDDLLTCKRLVIRNTGTSSTVDKKDVYAVKCCDGRIVRIFHDGCYTFLNPGDYILLYKVVLNPVSKGDIRRTKYYFSRSAGGDIEELSVANLKAAFSDKEKFTDALDTDFRIDADLCAYDNLHKCYKLNRIYEISK
ncbi:MAG TPA: hypothetical protein VKR41_03520, partial [Puia sp.]|nr:hypothetical protein [Puia sp.]